MENALRTTSPKNQSKNNTQNGTFLSDTSLSDITEKVSELSSRARDASTEAAERSIGFIKNYPIHTALGAVAVGFVLGAILKRSK